MILTVTPNPSIDIWLEVPDLQVGAFHRIARMRRSAGGKGVNVSRVIHALGGDTVALMAAGGEAGKEAGQVLKTEKIPVRIVKIDGETRLNYKVRSQKTSRTTEFNMPGPAINRQAKQALSQALSRLLAQADCCVFSGSVPAGLPPTYYRDGIFQAHREAVPTVLDASAKLLRIGLTAQPWLVKPNQEEAGQLIGRKINSLSRAKDAVRLLCSRGAAMVVLSLGDQGALWGLKKSAQFWYAKAPRVSIQSTVGCGDALLAGLLFSWSRGSTWPEALKLGVACGTASAMAPPGILCDASAVNRLLKRVQLKRLA